MSTATVNVLVESAKFFQTLGAGSLGALTKEAKGFIRSQQSKNVDEILSLVCWIHSMLDARDEALKKAMKGKVKKDKLTPDCMGKTATITVV